MARLPRLFLPSIPQHVIQRGNNRQACFYAEEDYRFYLECLGEAARKYRVSVHAYVLMTNHVHLLMMPSSAAGTRRVMQTLGRRYVRYVNHIYRRSGTLWEGRYHASLVQGDRYLLTCYRYIELTSIRDYSRASGKPLNRVWRQLFPETD
ncbi:MAG: transposase [bacterium]